MKPEERLQRSVASYLTLALPSDAAWSAIGHGGGGVVRGAKLKAMGVQAGVPDLFIAYRCRTLFIELKAPKPHKVSTSEEQKAFHAMLLKAGIRTRVCRSLDDVIMALREAGIPLLARIAA